jgi:hypothetical protein
MATARRRSPDALFRAQCSAAESAGDVVYVSGEVGGVPQVRTLDIDSDSKRDAVGMVIEKNGTECVVQRAGLVEGIYSGLTPGGRLWIDTAGRLDHTRPSRPSSGDRLLQSGGIALGAVNVQFVLMAPVLIIPL